MEENHFDPKKKKKLLETNRILSLTAIFVSVCTLFILIYQTHLSNKMYYLEEKAQKMSVFPYLQLGVSHSSQQYYRLLLTNTGVGPAMVKHVKILYKDSVYHMDPAFFLYNNIDETPDFYYAAIDEGRLVPANETVEVIANKTIGSTDIDYLANLFYSDVLNIAIEYTSIYEDQTWTCYLNDTPIFPNEPESDAMEK